MGSRWSHASWLHSHLYSKLSTCDQNSFLRCHVRLRFLTGAWRHKETEIHKTNRQIVNFPPLGTDWTGLHSNSVRRRHKTLSLISASWLVFFISPPLVLLPTGSTSLYASRADSKKSIQSYLSTLCPLFHITLFALLHSFCPRLSSSVPVSSILNHLSLSILCPVLLWTS